MAKPKPFRAGYYTLIEQRAASTRGIITISQARAAINKARRCRTATVQIHETTDRDGTPLHIAHIVFEPGTWTNSPQVTDLIEIPTQALTDL